MSINASNYIWFNGELVPWENATVHVLSHAIHYGSSVFEGLRVYATDDGSKVFRLDAHIQRLYDSAKIHRIGIPYDFATICAACHRVVAENGLTDGAYIRPVALRGYGEFGLSPSDTHPTDVAVAAWKWGAYLGADGLANGVDVCISSWNRIAPNTMPALAKAGGNYLSSSQIAMEAKRNGFTEGIALTIDGLVSEGAGENLFIVKDGTILTPPSAASILNGITRDSIIRLAEDLGYEIRYQDIPREMLYLADELFFTGTAAEVTPIRSVDRIEIGSGKCGPVTKQLQDAFFGLFSGSTEDKYGWLQRIEGEGSQVQKAAGAT